MFFNLFYALHHGCSLTAKVTNTKARRSPLTQGGLKIESTVSVDWGATNILNTDVLRKFIRDNYNEKGACRTILIHSLLRSEITRIVNEDQDIETEIIVDNLDNDVDEI